MRLFSTFFAVFFLFFIPWAHAATVMMEDMTWQEVEAAIHSGSITVIVPTGGTEQNGPHIVLGKHNFILRQTAPSIAERLGHTLVAPVMEYVPEGTIHPPGGHMRFAGTLSLRPETFAAVLEDTARSLKEHGFKVICFVGEHGASQPVQASVAEKLSKEWRDEGIKVIHVADYYNENNGQVAWMKATAPQEDNIEAHGGFADASEMLAAYPEGVHGTPHNRYGIMDTLRLGAEGDARNAAADYGRKLLELKVDAAVRQIIKESRS